MTDKKPRAPKVYEQPMQLVQGRSRDAGITWADLECGHTEPATGKDLYNSLRCEQCDPVLRGAPLPGWS